MSTSDAQEAQKLLNLGLEAYEEAATQGEAGIQAFRRKFIFTFVSGLLSSVKPGLTDGGEVIEIDPQRMAVREQGRTALRAYIAIHPGATALEKLRAGQAAMIEAYEAMADSEPRFLPELDLVRDTELWVREDSQVDENFAQEVLDSINL